MSLVVSGLSNYAKAEGFPLIVAAVTRSNTANYANVISGLKGTGLVPFLTSAVTIKAGGACQSFNGSGSTSTFTEVNVGVKPCLFEEAICIGALENKALIYATSGYDTVPFEQAFMQSKVDNISKALDALYWLGDTGNSDAFNGFTTQATAASLLTTITGSTSNVYDAIDLAIDTAVAYDATFESDDNVVVFLSYAKYRVYQKELVAKNYFHFNPGQIGDNSETLHPGTKIKVVPTIGLAGHSYLYLASADHLHIGTNLSSEAEGITVYHDMITNNIYMRSQFYAGTGVSKMMFKKAC